MHLGAGIGDVVLATPLLRVLATEGFTVDVLLDCDYPETAQLFEGWGIVRSVYGGTMRLPGHAEYERTLYAMPPFYWRRYPPTYDCASGPVLRSPASLFYRDEQAYFLKLAELLGCDVSDPPHYCLPRPSSGHSGFGALVLAPGSKTGAMAAKRWPFFGELAELFDNVVVVGTEDDLMSFDGVRLRFPRHVRCYVGCNLRETAALLAGAEAVVANDSGIGHMAGALGVPTVLLFGPTPHTVLGRLPPNVSILRLAFACAPCGRLPTYRSCRGRIDCLKGVSVAAVAEALRRALQLD